MALPVIRGASAANYPFTMTFSFLTGIGQWQNGTQQRWIRQPGARVKLSLPYGSLVQADKNTVKGAITSAKGRFDNTLSLTIGGTTYTNLGLDDDEWVATENRTTVYSAPIKLTQAIAQNLSPGSPGTAFPSLANGTIGILPYSQKKRFQTVQQRVEPGPAYSYAEFAGGLSGYPADGLFAWEFGADRMTDADVGTIVAHFLANWGRAYSFTFTDEDGTAYTKTHYASDELAITYRQVNDASVRIALEATN
jgi:hypothetical protein